MEDRIKGLLKDPVIVRVAKVIDRASLSILELLEAGIARKEINHALATGIVVFDKARVKAAEGSGVAGGDYYFDFLNSKIKLSDLGLSLLQYMQGDKLA